VHESQRVVGGIALAGGGDNEQCLLGVGQLSHLHYAVLALGDRSYAHYCAMGRQLDAWLQAATAKPLFACIDVDNADASALTRWQQQLARHIGQAVAPAPWAPMANQLWQLRQRELLNRGSQGGPVYHLQLVPADAELPAWQAGDIALIPPRNSAKRVNMWMQAHGVIDASLADGRRLSDLLAAAQLPQSLPAGDPAQWIPALPLITPREYSIASMPSEGHLALLLRRHTGPDGQPGLGSAWMCDVLQPGDPVQLRLRSNPSFHPPAAGVPLILIGNGTGIAGLRAQLRARIDMGARRNWLLFGERSAATDFHFQHDLELWQREGWLEQLDATFSRDGGADRHVQHRLARHADQLKQWLDQGAVVMVCGSLKGMAPDVDAVITQVLGSEGRDALLASGRYRRDVY
jgi:sulfite reductase (NADPH) flavoprotein alpha-component